MSKIVYEVSVDSIYTIWRLNGKLHREDGPAVVSVRGTEMWCYEDKPHREDGPAVIHPNGNKEWYKHGKLHRLDGPAVLSGSHHAHKEWWIDGVKYTYRDFNRKISEMKPTSETNNTIVEIDGQKYKLEKV